MKRILLTIQYDGTRYYGWQKQPDVPSVQEEIEKALKNMLGRPCELFGSGRTDAGVHALGQRAHFDMEENVPINKICEILNNLLPSDIMILKAQQVDPEFHARFSVKKKTYLYRVYIGKKKDVFLGNYAAWIRQSLDMESIQAAAKLLLGKHNFKGFCAAATAVNDFTRQIYDIQIVKKGSFINFTFTGNGFLYNMVRILVGTLIDVGRGRLPIENITKALKNGDRALVGVTMQPNGLYLKSVEY